MKKFLNFINLSFLPGSADFGILLLRLGTGLGMICLHGWAKWENRKWLDTADFKTRWPDLFEKAKWPDTLQINTQVTGWYLLVFAEIVCAVLIAAGFLTRLSSLMLGFGMGVAFFVSHGGRLTGDKNGEMAALYGLACLTIFLTGPGKFSIDGAGVPSNDGK
jgi:putative oxidoreductase